MIVKCISEYPSEEQIRKLGKGFSRTIGFAVTVGKEYIVLGLDFFVRSSLFGTGPYIMALFDNGYVSWAPLCLFEIVDPRASRFWEVRLHEEGHLTLQPPSFYKEYYNEDISEGVPEVVEDFKRVYAQLEAEAREGRLG